MADNRDTTAINLPSIHQTQLMRVSAFFPRFMDTFTDYPVESIRL
jgi:hypothetical protein